MGKCSFCSEIADENENNLFKELLEPYLKVRNRFIYESDSWIVMPSLGALVPGYLLIVSKKHYESIGKTPERYYVELDCLLQTLGEILYDQYKSNAIAFEHGAVSAFNRGGCCVDHAHLHVLPFNENLIEYIDKKFFSLKKIDSFDLLGKQVALGKPYLFYQRMGEEKVLIEGEFIPSQFFRKIIANRLGLQDKWDWKKEIFIDNIRDTLHRIKRKNIEKEFLKFWGNQNRRRRDNESI